MVGFSSLLPQHAGFLPHFLVYKQGLAAALHTVVCYVRSPTVALRQFSGSEAPRPHPLLSHVYGVKNFYTSAISFVGVLFLYITEVFVYRTARLHEAVFPYLFAGTGFIWMMVQRDWYLSP
ncbi:ergosterol biosynthesis protein-like protein Erg28 [Biscogniauxia marginata]|nr:ergosterol biosynthesis protein-like protein Erg28 [Biscogniauxia marginata]